MKFSLTLAINLSKEVIENGRNVLSVGKFHPTLDEKNFDCGVRYTARMEKTFL